MRLGITVSVASTPDSLEKGLSPETAASRQPSLARCIRKVLRPVNRPGVKLGDAEEALLPGGLDHGHVGSGADVGFEQMQAGLLEIGGVAAHAIEEALVADHGRVEACLDGADVAGLVGADDLVEGGARRLHVLEAGELRLLFVRGGLGGGRRRRQAGEQQGAG
jgi:hypothetical protein